VGHPAEDPERAESWVDGLRRCGGKVLVVLVLVEVESKPAPLKGTRVRHPAAERTENGEDGLRRCGKRVLVVLVLVEVESKPAPLKGEGCGTRRWPMGICVGRSD
jgi:hypothetical protein